MKIVVLILSLLFAHTLFASDTDWEGVILKKMLHSIAKSQEIILYVKDKTLQHEFDNAPFIHLSDNCKNCDFILERKEMNISCKKPAIVFNYNKYLHNSNAVAVFFWQKGRPTIRFSSKRLKYFGLHVQGELSKFVSTND